MFIHHLSNFRQKIDRVLSAGLVARVQAARLGLTGGLLGLAPKQTFHFMMRVEKDSPVLRNGSSKNFPERFSGASCAGGLGQISALPGNKSFANAPAAAKIC